MRISTGLFTLLASAVAVSQVSGQILVTSTLPYTDGDTVVYSPTTNALGATTYISLGLVTATGAVNPTTRRTTTSPTLLVPTTPTLAVPTTPTSVTTPTTRATKAATTTPRVVGQDSTALVVSTTFQYTTTNAAGDKTVFTSVFVPTFAATGVPVEPSAGTQYGYSEYMSLVGPSISAQASAIQGASTKTSGAGRAEMPVLLGVVGVAVGGLWTLMA